MVIFIAIVGLTICLILNAFFAGSETAIISINRLRLKLLEEAGLKKAEELSKLLEKGEELISMTLVGTNLSVVCGSVISTYLFSEWISDPFISTGISTVLYTTIVLIFGEIIPKTIFRYNSNKLCLRYVKLLKFFYYVFLPFNIIINFISRLFLLIFPKSKKIGHSLKSEIDTREDLKLLFEMSEEEGILPERQKELIESVFKFEDTIVREVMTPRVDMVVINEKADFKEAVDIIEQSGYSRIPVYREQIDNIVGVLYFHDLILHASEKKSISELMRKPFFVPEAKNIDALLKEMQKNKLHIAIVVDEYGSIAGLVTLEDLIEEIFGEIEDEFDSSVKAIRILKDGSMIVDAKLDRDELLEHTGIALEEGEYETIAGYVFSKLGRVPEQGEIIKTDQFIMTVLRVNKNRIQKVKIVKLPDETQERKTEVEF